ncbi:DNA primase family protein [Rhodovulum kholense]|uniref:Putative DNA primase/helicase n=1 Tax=Rhodovulum kholense TaxID=453584 RepID=A0A8E2VIW9_9RHOB|nr:DNA primase family protein [Rhodovulum kholense]PTW46051.1 putative DNA primase/helicase [Rhodovulum kholense]
MTDDPLDRVRGAFAAADDVDMGDMPEPDAPEAPETEDRGGAEPPHPPEGGTPDDPLGPVRAAAEQPLNDYGNGQRFCIHFGEDLTFVPRVGWFVWTGTHWEKDPDELAVRRKAQRIWALIEQEVEFLEPTKAERKVIGEERDLLARLAALEALPEAERGTGHDEECGGIRARLKSIEAILKDRKSLIGRRLTHAKNAGNSGPIGNMIDQAQPALARAYEDLDADPPTINTLSGTLRFSAAGAEGMSPVAEMRVQSEHLREDLLSKIMPVAYDRAAKAPRWDAFLEEILPDATVREFVQRWMGLSMTGIKMQRLAFFYGGGANGKSVLVDTIARVLGPYAATARIESLTGTNRRGGGDATPDLIPLMGARFVRTSEPDEGQRLQEGLIKELTGGEPLMIRALHSDFLEFSPYFKLTMSGNHKPEIRGTDDGIWRRVLLAPFDVQIPEDRRDPDLANKLWEEAPGILNWLIGGLTDFLEGGLRPPERVLEATAEYREESDPVGAFLTESAIVTGAEDDFIHSRDLIEAFNFWLEDRGETRWGGRTVSNRLKQKASRWRHPQTGKSFIPGKRGATGYRGIRLTDEFRARMAERLSNGAGAPVDEPF